MRNASLRLLIAALVSSLLIVSPSSMGWAAVLPVGARHGMVVSTRAEASRVGVEVLRRGGNAVDAAVAVALALAVLWPSAGNLGGGGFMLVRMAKGPGEIIDFRERAPLAASRDMYLDQEGRPIPGASTLGWKAVATPGTVAGLAMALARHGTRSFAELAEPARQLAMRGFVVDAQLAENLRRGRAVVERDPEARRIFFRDGEPLQVGDHLVQRDLASTLKRLQRSGPREFYTGQTAKRIVAAMEHGGGILGARDLAEYQPTLRQPLHGSYRGYELLTMPPPSSGGALLIEMLRMLSATDVAALPHHGAAELHLLVEVMRRAFADRSNLFGDADFVQVPVAALTSPDYARRRAADIDPARATPSSALATSSPTAPPRPLEKPETTHFVVVDGAGNVVTCTYTLNGLFGAGVVAPGTGVLLNDEMDDFASAPGVPNQFGLVQGEPNAIAPRKRPLSTMTPTLLLKDGRPFLALGSPGGPTIVSTVLQLIVDVVDYKMNLREAMDDARVHHQYLPDHIAWEPWGLAPETRAALETMGHVFAAEPRYLGDAQAVLIDEAGVRWGACDRRGGGVPMGY